MRKLRSTMTRILVAAIVVFGLSTTAATPAHAAAGGTVRCANGGPIQGIWVEALDPAKRGWANRWSLGTSWENGWSHAPLNPGDTYQVHVGCGSWSPTYKSAMTNVHSGDFICHVYYRNAQCVSS